MGGKSRIMSRWGAVGLLSVVSLAAATMDIRLVDAVKNQDVQAVRALLQEKTDVNAPQADGTTALAWAVDRNDLETADLQRARDHARDAQRATGEVYPVADDDEPGDGQPERDR